MLPLINCLDTKLGNSVMNIFMLLDEVGVQPFLAVNYNLWTGR